MIWIYMKAFAKEYIKQIAWDEYMKHKGSPEEWSRFVNNPNGTR